MSDEVRGKIMGFGKDGWSVLLYGNTRDVFCKEMA